MAGPRKSCFTPFLIGKPDELVDCSPCSQRISDWDLYLEQDELCREETQAIQRNGTTGRNVPKNGFRFLLQPASSYSWNIN